MRFLAFIPIFLYSVLYLSRGDGEGFHAELTRFFELAAKSSLDFFFFLSAFLITSQGLREYKYTQQFDLRKYLIRRALRIAPLFIIGLLFTFMIHPWIMQTLKLNEIITPSGMSYWLLFPNYFSDFTNEQYIYMAIIWTIYMFIQFYIFWGFILKFLKQNLEIVAGVLIAIGVIARIIHGYMDIGYEFDTLSYGVPVGIGALVASIIRKDSPIIERIKNFSKSTNIVIYVLGAAVTLGGYLISKGAMMISIIPLFTGIFFGYLMIEQTFGKNSIVKLRTYKIHSHLGKISYGLIVYQAIINVLVAIAINSLDFEITSTSVKLSFLGVSFAISWIMADLSYNLLEKPLLRLRREFKKI